MKADRLYTLFQRYLEQSASPEEQIEFLKALSDPSHADILKNWIEEHWEKESLPKHLSHRESEDLYKSIRKVIIPRKKILNLTSSYRAAAAVLIVAVLITGAYFLGINSQRKVSHKMVAQTHDVKAPGISLARITLDNGHTLYLDSLKQGSLALHKGVTLIKMKSGQIGYKGTSEKTVYNTLSNPRGSKTISITLSDGTKIWLNAASKLRYPIVFTGKERKVEVSGEAYFEVAKNPEMPFIVDINDKEQLKVLGTHFNVNAYIDEYIIKTTLLEGSVQVTFPAGKVVLKPNEQVRQDKLGKIQVIKADINKVMAWKQNMFYFNDTNIESIMNSLSRWYDIKVEYKSDDVKQLAFGGIISRRANVSAILNLLKKTGTVDFEIRGRTVIVKKI